MDYEFLQNRGALNEQLATKKAKSASKFHRESVSCPPLDSFQPPHDAQGLLPAEFAHEYQVLPIAFDGETLTVAASDSDDLALTDRLRFLLAVDVELVSASSRKLRAAINRVYQDEDLGDVSASSMISLEGNQIQAIGGSYGQRANVYMPEDELAEEELFEDQQLTASASLSASQPPPPSSQKRKKRVLSETLQPHRATAMFYQTIQEGERVLVGHNNGTADIVEGPKQVWVWGKKLTWLERFTAHPGDFLVIRFYDGRQEHLSGPAEVWFDPRVHQSIQKKPALQLSAKEAVVVYSRQGGAEPQKTTRRIVYGPGLFTPEPGEWLHKFSWHASKGGSKGVQKVPHGLVFQKLWLMPDQMYHDVHDVRTADDAVLTIRLMIFFELLDIERMLDASHDPIGDLINAATADAVEFTGRYDFEAFKQNTDKLNDLATYRQLTHRASQCGYQINNVVYRGYGAPDSLQQMHDQAIEARTRLQLEKATEQQAQELENYKLECQLDRAGKRRGEQTDEVRHEIELADQKAEANLRRREKQAEAERRLRRSQSEMQDGLQRSRDAVRQEHLAALQSMGVDLTAFLTQDRADQVIEVRGEGKPHLHLEGKNETE